MAGTPKGDNKDDKENHPDAGSYDSGLKDYDWAEDHNDLAATINRLHNYFASTHVASGSAHHTKYTDANAVDAVEGVSNAPIATGDSVIFKDVSDSGNLKRDLVSDLLALAGGISGTYIVWIPIYEIDLATTTTNATTGSTNWGGGSIQYSYGSGTPGSYAMSLSKFLPQDIAGSRVTIDNVRGYFWKTVGTCTVTLTKQQPSRSGVNDAATQVGTSTTWVFVTSATYYIQVSGESIESDHFYWMDITGVPVGANPRLMGMRISYSIA